MFYNKRIKGLEDRLAHSELIEVSLEGAFERGRIVKDRLDQLEGHLYISDGFNVKGYLCGDIKSSRVTNIQDGLEKLDIKIGKLLDYLSLEYVDKIETNIIKSKRKAKT